MSPHVWIQDDDSDPEIGLMVKFDGEPTSEEIAVFEDLARWIREEHRAGRPVFNKRCESRYASGGSTDRVVSEG